MVKLLLGLAVFVLINLVSFRSQIGDLFFLILIIFVCFGLLVVLIKKSFKKIIWEGNHGKNGSRS